MTKNEFFDENIFEILKNLLTLVVSLSKNIFLDEFRKRAREFIECNDESSIEVVESQKIEHFFDVCENLSLLNNLNFNEIHANIVFVDDHL